MRQAIIWAGSLAMGIWCWAIDEEVIRDRGKPGHAGNGQSDSRPVGSRHVAIAARRACGAALAHRQFETGCYTPDYFRLDLGHVHRAGSQTTD